MGERAEKGSVGGMEAGDMESGGVEGCKTLAQEQAPYLPHRVAWPTLLDLHVPCGT